MDEDKQHYLKMLEALRDCNDYISYYNILEETTGVDVQIEETQV